MRKIHDHLQNAIIALYETKMISLKGILEVSFVGNDEELAQEILEIKKANRHTAKPGSGLKVQRWLDLYHQDKKYSVYLITTTESGEYTVSRRDRESFVVPWSKIPVASVNLPNLKDARAFLESLPF